MGFSLFAANQGFLDDVDVKKVGDFEAALIAFVKSNYADLVKKLNDTADFNDDIAGKMREAIQKFKSSSTW